MSRKRATEDIVVEVENVGGFDIKTYIQSRTVIEDTESSVNLGTHGWTFVNYPERLSYSTTSSDFRSLVVQRRRWASSGLLILRRLWNQMRERKHRRQRTLVHPEEADWETILYHGDRRLNRDMRRVTTAVVVFLYGKFQGGRGAIEAPAARKATLGMNTRWLMADEASLAPAPVSLMRLVLPQGEHFTAEIADTFGRRAAALPHPLLRGRRRGCRLAAGRCA